MAYRTQLDCDVAAVFLKGKDPGDEDQSFLPFGIVPKGGKDHPLYKKAFSYISREIPGGGFSLFLKKLPTEVKAGELGTLLLMALDGRGILFLGKQNGRFNQDMIRMLLPLNRKFARSIDACMSENELISSRELYRNLVSMLPVMIIETDSAGIISYLNHQVINSLGRERKTLYGSHIDGIIIGNIWQQLQESRAYETGASSLINGSEVRVAREEGGVFPALLYVDRLHGEKGQSSLRFVLVDITERLEAENIVNNMNRILEERVEERTVELNRTIEALKKAQKQLIQSEKMASIGQLAAGVAHEINNPTGFVLSNLETLEEYVAVLKDISLQMKEATDLYGRDGSSPALKKIFDFVDKKIETEDLSYITEDVGPLLTSTRKGATRIRDIVKGLREFARPDLEGMVSNNLNEIVESAIELVWNRLKYKCTIEKRLEKLPEITCNRNQIEQVIINLLVNASDAIEKMGTIRIYSRNNGSCVLLEVSDNGKGIPEEHISQLFDPFFTTKEVGKGTGLGLSISHGIVINHQGSIDVKSTPGKGTTFTIRLPLRQEEGCGMVPGE